MNDLFSPPQPSPIAGARFEHFYCPEWRQWVVIDRQEGTLARCEDRGAAAERAGMLEAIRRLVRDVAESTRLN